MLSEHLATSTAPPPPPSKRATRYGQARYGTPRYGYRPPGEGRAGTLAFVADDED